MEKEMVNSKKLFWVIMSIVAVVAVAAGVAVFVMKYLKNKKDKEELGEYCDELEGLYYDEDDFEEIEEDEQ